MSDFWKAALTRAKRTVFQTLAGSFPAGVVVTVEMLKNMDMAFVWTVLAWLATGLLAGLASILTSLATGLPETENKTETVIEYRYLDDNGVPVDGNYMTVLNNENEGD